MEKYHVTITESQKWSCHTQGHKSQSQHVAKELVDE